MRRGFKAFAEALALQTREQLGLTYNERLDPRKLAAYLRVRIVELSALTQAGASPGSISHLTDVDRGAFSAATVVSGRRRLIVYNSVHSSRRIANSLAHEVSHLLLDHAPGLAVTTLGCRLWNAEQEEEADHLGGCLLVPRQAALECCRARLSLPSAAARFGVSVDLMRWRMNHSGATRQAEAERRQVRLRVRSTAK